jgi:hypothetical protein
MNAMEMDFAVVLLHMRVCAMPDLQEVIVGNALVHKVHRGLTDLL